VQTCYAIHRIGAHIKHEKIGYHRAARHNLNDTVCVCIVRGRTGPFAFYALSALDAALGFPSPTASFASDDRLVLLFPSRSFSFASRSFIFSESSSAQSGLDGILPISPSRVCILQRSQSTCTAVHGIAPRGTGGSETPPPGSSLSR
jgi:hypothetical protein